MSTLLKAIPKPEKIRARLGANVRENQLLRALIRVAQAIEAERVETRGFRGRIRTK